MRVLVLTESLSCRSLDLAQKESFMNTSAESAKSEPRPARRVFLRVGAGAFAASLVGCSTPAQVSRQPTASPATAVPGTATSGTVVPSGPSPTAVPQVSALSCVVTPALTEGPYFVDERLNRSDIRSDPSDNTMSAGVPLTLSLQVVRVTGNTCVPLANAAVDVWQCNALGVYSDVADPSGSTRGRRFLRGYQTTGTNGMVNFTTIYPGWYSGRAVHIHFKVRTDINARNGEEFTSQWSFDDTLSDQVFTQAPYSSRPNRNTRNTNDGIFRQTGNQMMLPVTRTNDGYATTFTIGLRSA